MRDSLLNKTIADKIRSYAEYFCMDGVMRTSLDQGKWAKSLASLGV
jgi:hypothetical protein